MQSSMFGQRQQPLAQNTHVELARIASNTSNASLAQLQGMAQAQGVMQAAAEEQPHIEIPRVNFYPSHHQNPRKARRKDIKQAYRLLKPTKRRWFSPLRWLGSKYRYNKNTSQCCVDGCDVDYLLKVMGNVYNEIRDEDTGQSLWDLYFIDPVSGESRAFLARENVTDGRTMRATYCPEHLHLYHVLTKWEKEEDRERDGSKSTLRERVKKGVSMVAVPITAVAARDNTPPTLQKYEPFFRMLRADKIPVQHLKNTRTGENRLTIVIFDAEQFADGALGEPLLTSQVQTGEPAPVGAGLQQMLAETQASRDNLPEVE